MAWLCLVLWCCCSRPLADLGVVDILCVAVSSCLLKGVCVCVAGGVRGVAAHKAVRRLDVEPRPMRLGQTRGELERRVLLSLWVGVPSYSINQSIVVTFVAVVVVDRKGRCSTSL